MIPQTGQANERRSSVRGLLVSCAILAGILAPFTIAVAWFAYGRSGAIGIAAAAIAGGVCWVSASLALATVYLGQMLKNPVGGILGGMFFRMGLPLGVGIAIQQSHPPLANAGTFLMILALYLVALIAETLLSLKIVSPGKANVASETKAVSGSTGVDGSTAVAGPTVAGGIPGR